MLIDLGLAAAVEGLSEIQVPKKEGPKKSAQKRKPLDSQQPTEPERRSKRLRGDNSEVKRFTPPREEPREERKPRPNYKPGRSMDERLKEIELGHLVDLNKSEALFIVLGSTRKPYKVLLSDKQRKCGCLDWRLRKRDCKHITLILRRLKIQDSPEDWHAAVSQHLDELPSQDS
mmetsp:Transcript_34068/g.53101  ORF Transcript_34068/g.53101 Transcript_34068/m.53101 type:complete len:174 (+) Transcript_34068:632-1153(+)|eukprot:CAMPEP_0184296504 /NCGR_PEP_ID=MMETSP1049-20130417/7478_1 /TAXON_ID=77928 /ORGANISM="Proteomonas sulcata, Strain CCMP704" /LENGTH=173 /DNA_ID=CAMNT_0026605773 /DNA_START=627 /DNA_END=1148 /DNA_ORIENTATION=+